MKRYTTSQYLMAAVTHNVMVFITMVLIDVLKIWPSLKTFWQVRIRSVPAKDYHLQEYAKLVKKSGGGIKSDPLFFIALKVCGYLKLDKHKAKLVIGQFMQAGTLVYTTDKESLEWIHNVSQIKTGTDFFDCFQDLTGFSATALCHGLGQSLYERLISASVDEMIEIIYSVKSEATISGFPPL
jgi:hypothetical protein